MSDTKETKPTIPMSGNVRFSESAKNGVVISILADDGHIYNTPKALLDTTAYSRSKKVLTITLTNGKVQTTYCTEEENDKLSELLGIETTNFKSIIDFRKGDNNA